MVDILFYVFGFVAVGGALGVVLAKSPVGSLLFMVTTLASMAGTFVLLEAHFLAAIQIIVYAGAIMVLFLFVIMLLNLGHDYERDLKGGVFSIISFATVGAMAGVLQRQFRGAALPDAITTGGASIDAALAEFGVVGAIAEPLYTTYVVAFEITGILLLVAIVGALVLAKRSPA
ncbi:MAG: NADH-quinone oxidoreductase subunit J [Gemmatimonadales bacterium]|nr:NADH-quinone oxidoreductase subunit J [Gemmatimonadales bacterium]MDG2238664.1 NADH-quinone oxidoreductase subunit J [Longimicrobiales bacterium]NCG34169.1 NADH-quinone oxidoreductase subunit J [Pseudomonadota bacterium]MBT3498397.1 NADH-quinone oxidoreductase subunit J [Gemmatimonadales bacterium]MBT3773952.1 NADH-quinone oxidoreductase subunit J [Gemmatimonadales bacterium]